MYLFFGWRAEDCIQPSDRNARHWPSADEFRSSNGIVFPLFIFTTKDFLVNLSPCFEIKIRFSEEESVHLLSDNVILHGRHQLCQRVSRNVAVLMKPVSLWHIIHN